MNNRYNLLYPLWKIKWHDPGDCDKKARNENTRALTFFFLFCAPPSPPLFRPGNSCFINTRVAIFARLMSNWQTSFAKLAGCLVANVKTTINSSHWNTRYFFIYRHRRPCVKVDNNFTIYIDPAVFPHLFFFFPPFSTFHSQRYRFITACSNCEIGNQLSSLSTTTFSHPGIFLMFPNGKSRTENGKSIRCYFDVIVEQFSNFNINFIKSRMNGSLRNNQLLLIFKVT